MKKRLSVFAFLFCAITISAQETVTTIDGIKYFLDNGQATIMVQSTTLSGSITIPEKVTYNNTIYAVNNITNAAFKGSAITDIILPNSITSLGESCFAKCANLMNITLPKNITSLAYRCFYQCASLTSITLPKGITSLGESCFGECSSLTSVILPDGITSLGDDCFSLSGLTSITLPKGITSLGNFCFFGCSGLTNMTIPTGITSLGNYCFYKCSGLMNITLPNSLLSIGDQCFAVCSGLTSIMLPNSITSLGDQCFYGCSGLTNITFSNSIISIGEKCFASCTNLMKIRCQWESLDKVSADADAFYGIFSEAKLYVPRGTTAIYKAKDPWNKFKYIVEDDPSAINLVKQRRIMVQSNNGFLSVSGLNNQEMVSLYNVFGVKLNSAKAISGIATFNVNTTDKIVIIKIGEESIKVEL